MTDQPLPEAASSDPEETEMIGAPSSAVGSPDTVKSSRLAPLLQQMIERNASDLFIIAGVAPSMRVDGAVAQLPDRPFTSEDIDTLIEDMLTDEQFAEFESTLELNIAHTLNQKRFRVNLMRQKYSSAVVIRRIKSHIPTSEDLHLPPIYNQAMDKMRGLVLVVGASGQGKSTSLASMIAHRNQTGNGHIITIEDPIEFIHEHDKCIVTQREIGIDTFSYSMALKNALRQSPDVLVIGEIRDRETLEHAILFSETGHLVLSTLHANNCSQAIERIVNLFPEEMQKQILSTLAQNLNVVMSQRLVESTQTTERELAYEVMINQGLIKVLIEEGKVKELHEVMERNRDLGMITFDQCLFDLIKEKKVTVENALRESDNPSALRLRIAQELDNTHMTMAANQAPNPVMNNNNTGGDGEDSDTLTPASSSPDEFVMPKLMPDIGEGDF